MRLTILLTVILIFFGVFSFSSANAPLPPFPSLTISGEANEKFDLVSLFKDGSAAIPLKTSHISSSGRYSLSIYLPEDLEESGDYYSIDMRFWKDKNDNGERDSGDSYSQCHFIIWDPAAGKVFLKVYDGPQYEIKSSDFEYNYQ